MQLTRSGSELRGGHLGKKKVGGEERRKGKIQLAEEDGQTHLAKGEFI